MFAFTGHACVVRLRTCALVASARALRRPFRDSPRLILTGILVLVAVLVGILVLADRTSRLSPDFLTEVVLYALSATNVMMLLALAFVLARNVVKLLVERRRAIPFVAIPRQARLRSRSGMTLVPSGARAHRRHQRRVARGRSVVQRAGRRSAVARRISSRPTTTAIASRRWPIRPIASPAC